MPDTTTTQDSTAEQRRIAQHKYTLEMDYHLMNLHGLMRATAHLAGEVQNTLTPKDSGGDVECLITLLFLMRDHVVMMEESTDRRSRLEMAS